MTRLYNYSTGATFACTDNRAEKPHMLQSDDTWYRALHDDITSAQDTHSVPADEWAGIVDRLAN